MTSYMAIWTIPDYLDNPLHIFMFDSKGILRLKSRMPFPDQNNRDFRCLELLYVDRYITW